MMINSIDFEARVKVCKECPVYNKQFGTCGPPINAINPFKRPHQIGEITFKPCGCPVDHLASYAATDCPAKLWPILEEKDWKMPTLEHIREIRKRGRLAPGEMAKLFKLRREYLGIRDGKSFTSCTPCMNELLNKLEKQLEGDLAKVEQAEALIELTQVDLTPETITEVRTTPQKKRRAKRKKL
jgi:hypothetical protein